MSARPRRYRGTHRPTPAAAADRAETARITGAWQVGDVALAVAHERALTRARVLAAVLRQIRPGRHTSTGHTPPRWRASVHVPTAPIDQEAIAAMLDADHRTQP